MLRCSFTRKELQMNQVKHKNLSPQIQFAALTHDKQIKPVPYLVEHETVLLSQEEDCHPSSLDFGKDFFSNRINKGGVKIIFKPRGSIFLKLWNLSEISQKNQSKSLPKHHYDNLQIWMLPLLLILMSLMKKRYHKMAIFLTLIYHTLTIHLLLENRMILKMKVRIWKLFMKPSVIKQSWIFHSLIHLFSNLYWSSKFFLPTDTPSKNKMIFRKSRNRPFFEHCI